MLMERLKNGKIIELLPCYLREVFGHPLFD